MPHIIVKLAEGRSQPLKPELADRLAATLMDVFPVALIVGTAELQE